MCKMNMSDFLSLNLLKLGIRVKGKAKVIGINSQCLAGLLKSFVLRIIVAFVGCKVLSKGIVKIPS